MKDSQLTLGRDSISLSGLLNSNMSQKTSKIATAKVDIKNSFTSKKLFAAIFDISKSFQTSFYP